MFNPTSTITVTGWLLQSVNKSVSKNRAQALTASGDEHAATLWGERTTETAEFTLGGSYGASDTITVPALGAGITDWTLTYSETEYPTLSVSKDSAAGGATFAYQGTLPARSIGIPSAIEGIYTAATGCKQVSIQLSCQHVEETDGSGAYAASTMSGMRDVTMTVTFTGVSGKPTITAASGFTEESNAENNSNTAIGGGSVVYTKHFAMSDGTAST